MLLVDKMVGHIIPVRFLLLAVIGGIGVLIHLALLWFGLNPMRLSVAVSQTIATGIAMFSNFTLNNWLRTATAVWLDGNLQAGSCHSR